MNILIVGLGSIALKHIDAIRKLKITTTLYALRSSVNADIKEGITNIYNIEKCDVYFDFAIISNPTNFHFQYIEILAKKGVNLFIEKPPVSSLNNLDKLIDFTEKTKIINYVACNLRFHPCLKFLKKELYVRNKRINELNVYCGSYLPDWRPLNNFRKVYSSIPDMGGGVHLDLFHEFDFTTWIFGIPTKSYCTLRNQSSLDIEAIDYANYLLEYDTFTASLILNYYRKDTKRTLEILFEDDTWTVDLINNSIKDRAGYIIFESPNFIISNTYYDQMDYFINCLNQNQQPMNSLKESIEVLKIVLQNEL
jgi:predicted dehydrogenase